MEWYGMEWHVMHIIEYKWSITPYSYITCNTLSISIADNYTDFKTCHDISFLSILLFFFHTSDLEYDKLSQGPSSYHTHRIKIFTESKRMFKRKFGSFIRKIDTSSFTTKRATCYVTCRRCSELAENL